MAFNFLNLDKDVRSLMLTEVENEIENNSLYLSKRFSPEGMRQYPDLLKLAIFEGTEETLGTSLNKPGMFVLEENRKTENGVITAKVPSNAPFTLAEGEFNRFYMRGVCLKAINEGKIVEVYRAKNVSTSRLDSEAKIGQKIKPENLLQSLRTNTVADDALELPSGPNSGLSIKIVD